MAERKSNNRIVAVIVMVLAWAVPGAGHVFIGRVTRGIIIFVTITATFWAGVAMGGVMTVDSRTERWWFAANMCTGVNGLTGWYRSKDVYAQAELELASDAYATRLRDDHSLATSADGRMLTSVQQVDVSNALRLQYVDKILSDKGYRLSPPAETVARAYAGVAGLLNALCIFDVVLLALMGKGLESIAGKRRRRQGEGER